MRIVYDSVKRIFDVFAASIAVLVFLIPWIIISVIIKIQSPGPIIYKARRLGKDGKIFTLYKFRSMKVDSGKVHTTTLRNDPRIFPFGSFLRKSKLDETPQLINILKGEMSIIGPRPEDEENASWMYVGKFKEIPTALPGLSSPASLYDYAVGEKYDSEEAYKREFLNKKLEVELYYVKHRALWYDFTIIFRTVTTILAVLSDKEVKIPWEVKRCLKKKKSKTKDLREKV